MTKTTITPAINKATNRTPTITEVTTPLFTTDYHVYINHTDAGGIVYHANHLVFFENCRRDWFTKIGLNGYFLQTDEGQVQHFVVSQAELQYKKAIFLDEIINVRIDKVELKPASIIFYQSIHRNLSKAASVAESNATNTLLSSTKIVIACVQNQIKPNPTPQPSDQLTNQDSVSPNMTPVVVASAPPIRAIRVPQKLHDIIQQAIAQHSARE